MNLKERKKKKECTPEKKERKKYINKKKKTFHDFLFTVKIRVNSYKILQNRQMTDFGKRYTNFRSPNIFGTKFDRQTNFFAER